jgi:hypothetical protein
MALLAKDAGTIQYSTRLAMVVQAMLLSPKFLFRPEIGDATRAGTQGVPLTSWEMAARLSYFLTGSIPDAELAAAADAGALSTPDEVVKQARRLMTSPRAQTQLVKFHTMWLGTDTVSALAKNMNAYPDFHPLLAYYMAKETDQFLRKTLFEEGGTFASLMLSDHTYVNGPMAEFYGIQGPGPDDADDWVRAPLNTSQRVGLLTQASLLATMAKEDRTDPVRRGKFVLNQILCRTVQPPPPSIVAMFQPLDLSKTAREQFTQHRTNEVCASCHNTIDPLGLPFEHYDGIGQWRTMDQTVAVDSTGAILLDGQMQTFPDALALAQLLAASPQAQACFAKQMTRYALNRWDTAADAASIDSSATTFKTSGNMRDLIGAVATSRTFRYRTPVAGEVLP